MELERKAGWWVCCPGPQPLPLPLLSSSPSSAEHIWKPLSYSNPLITHTGMLRPGGNNDSFRTKKNTEMPSPEGSTQHWVLSVPRMVIQEEAQANLSLKGQKVNRFSLRATTSLLQ